MTFKLEPTMTWGHVLQAVTILAAAAAIFVNQARVDARQDERLRAADDRLRVVEVRAASNAQDLTDMRETIGRVDERTQYMVQQLQRLERRGDE